MRSGDWKLLHNGGKKRVPTSGIVNREKYLTGTRLFNLKEDRGESRDLAEKHPDIVRRLQRLYLDWSNEVADNGKGTPQMKQWTFTTALLILCASVAHAAARSDKPNVLFILVDDMGWRDLACYGHEIHETPNIDRLASRGMRFTDAYAACPICAPSRAAIMTGKFPSNSGFVDNYAHEWNGKTLQRAKERQSLKLKEVTLAETFKAGGYQTGFVGIWHLSGTNESRLPTDQGFDVNVAGGWWGHPRGRTGYFSPYNMFALKDGPKGEYLTDRLTSEAIQVMDNFSKRDNRYLHPRGNLVRSDPRSEQVLLRALSGVLLIQLRQQPAGIFVCLCGYRLLCEQVADRLVPTAKQRSLMLGRQEAAAPVARAVVGQTPSIGQHDKRR